MIDFDTIFISFLYILPYLVVCVAMFLLLLWFEKRLSSFQEEFLQFRRQQLATNIDMLQALKATVDVTARFDFWLCGAISNSKQEDLDDAEKACIESIDEMHNQFKQLVSRISGDEALNGHLDDHDADAGQEAPQP